MDILFKGFCGKNHSWSIIHQSLAREFNDYNVDMFSTNGISYFPNDLKTKLKGYIEENDFKNLLIAEKDLKKIYDVQISYTAMKNFEPYLSRGKKKFGIWCWEWSGKNSLPYGFAKSYKFCDQLLPPTEYAKQVFIDSGVPASHMTVVPHGIDKSYLENTDIYQLKTNKKFKFLSIFAQPHMRKALSETIEAYFKAFTNKDDVTFVFKAQLKIPQQSFEVDFNKTLNALKLKYPNHPEVIILKDFIPDLSSLYRACDSYICISKCEGFGMPALEALASKKILITSNFGGPLDFCNETNSLLVSGQIEKAPPKSLYWEQHNRAYWFQPNTDDTADKMICAYNNKDYLLNKFDESFNQIRKQYTWTNAANKIKSLI